MNTTVLLPPLTNPAITDGSTNIYIGLACAGRQSRGLEGTIDLSNGGVKKNLSTILNPPPPLDCSRAATIPQRIGSDKNFRVVTPF
jgi:hypothetical protein